MLRKKNRDIGYYVRMIGYVNIFGNWVILCNVVN